MFSSPILPSTWTNFFDLSLYSLILIEPSSLTKYRGDAPSMALSTIALLSWSICICVSRPISVMPYPQMLPSTGYRAIETKGYNAWSYSPFSASGLSKGTVIGIPVSGSTVTFSGPTISFSVAYNTMSLTYLTYCSVFLPFIYVW